jgi:hypothetical protein
MRIIEMTWALALYTSFINSAPIEFKVDDKNLQEFYKSFETSLNYKFQDIEGHCWVGPKDKINLTKFVKLPEEPSFDLPIDGFNEIDEHDRS